MKKRTVLTMGAVLCMAMTAFASESDVAEEQPVDIESTEEDVKTADELEVTQKNLYELSGEYYSDQGYFFAKVENNTSEGRYVGDGKLVCFSEDDDVLVSANYVTSSPCSNIWLEPGEYCYVYESIWEDELEESDIADVKFSIKSGEYGYIGERVECEAEFFYSEEDTYNNEIYVTYSNPKDEPTDCFYIAVALLDEEDNILYVGQERLYNVKLHPGSTVTQTISISAGLCEYFVENGIVPASVDAQVYYIEN